MTVNTRTMQNPNEDTEWNDILRAKGIIPQKEKEISEDQIVSMLEETIEKKTQGKWRAKWVTHALANRVNWFRWKEN